MPGGAGGAKPLTVAAGILRRDTRVLACQRLRDGDPYGGKWELPGGKLQDGESAAEALVRELREELGIVARPGAEVERVEHLYPVRGLVRLHFFEVERFHGEPSNLGFETIRWASVPELLALDWLEADLPLVRRLAAGAGSPLAPLEQSPRW